MKNGINKTKEELMNDIKSEVNTKFENNNRIYKKMIVDAKTEYNKNEIKLKLNELDIEDMEKNPIVKKYKELLEKRSILEEKKELSKYKLKCVNELVCKHPLLFLYKLDTNSEHFTPCYKCLLCEKNIYGLVDINQICVNSNYVQKKENVYYGKESEYKKLRDIYLSLCDEHSIKDIADELEEYQEESIDEKRYSAILLYKK